MRNDCADTFEAAISDGYDIPGSKVEKCEHDRFGWEDCIACYDIHLMASVTAIRAATLSKEGE